MTWSRKLSAYPPELGSILEEALKGPLSISFEDIREAHQMRYMVYGYRRALKRERPEAWAAISSLQLLLRPQPDQSVLLIIQSSRTADRIEAMTQQLAKKLKTRDLQSVQQPKPIQRPSLVVSEAPTPEAPSFLSEILAELEKNKDPEL